MKTTVLVLAGLSTALAAERAVIPNCCSSTSSISLYSPAVNSVLHTFELSSYVVTSAISRDGTEDYLVVSDSDTSPATGLATLNLSDGKLSPVTDLPSNVSAGAILSIAASPAAPVFYVLYTDLSGVPHLVCYSAELTIVSQTTLPPAYTGQLYVSPKGDRIYLVTGSSAGGLIEVDAKTLEVTRMLLPGALTFEVTETADESTLFVYTKNNESGAVCAVNVADGTVTESIPLTGIVNSFTAAPDGSEVFIVNGSSVTRIAIPSQQAVTYTDNPNYGLGPPAGFSPDGTTLYLDLFGGGFMQFNIASGVFTPATTPWGESVQVAQNGRLVLQDASSPGIVTGPVPSSTPALTFAGAATAAAWDEASDSVYLAVANSNVVQALDDRTFQPKGELAFSPGIEAQMLAAGGGYLYVGTAVSGEFGGPAAVVKCDPSTLAQLATFNLPAVYSYNAPQVGNGFVSPDGSKLYVEYIYTQPVTDLSPAAQQSSAGSGSPSGNQIGIAVFDTASGEMLNSFPLTAPSALAARSGGTTAYVSWQAGIDNRTVGILQLDLDTGSVVKSVTLYTSPAFRPPPVNGPMLSADGSVLVAALGDGVSNTELFVLDPATLAVKNKAALAITGLLAVTPDGQYLYAVEQGPSLVVVDLSTLEIVNTESISTPAPSVALIM